VPGPQIIPPDAGLTVYVGSRDAARGERAVEEIGGDTRLLVLNVTDDASIADAARLAGTLDILVNNAGISGDDKTPDQEDADTFRRIYQTNVFGVVAVTNAFLPALRRSAHPRIVNVSSGTGSLTRARSNRSSSSPARWWACSPDSLNKRPNISRVLPPGQQLIDRRELPRQAEQLADDGRLARHVAAEDLRPARQWCEEVLKPAVAS
jgi:short chain dehydrogenase